MQMSNGNGAVATTEPIDHLVRQLNDPNTASALSYLLNNAQLLAFLVASLDGVLKRGEELTDNIGSTLREFNASGQNGASLAAATEQLPELLHNLPQLLKATNKVAVLANSKEFDELLNAERLATLKPMLDQLSNAQTMAALTQIINNAPLIALLVNGLDGVIKRGEELTDNIGSAVREMQAGDAGLNIAELTAQLPQLMQGLPGLIKAGTKVGALTDSKEFDALLDKEKLSSLLRLVNQVNEPESLAALSQLVKHAPLLAFMLNSVEGALKRGEEITDNLGSAMREFSPNGNALGLDLAGITAQVPQVLQSLPGLMKAGAKVGAISDSKEFDELLDREKLTALLQVVNKVNQPNTLEALGQIAQHAPLMALLLNGLDGVIRRGDVLADNLSTTLKEINPNLNLPISAAEFTAITKQLPELFRRLPVLLRAGNKVAEVTDSEEFETFLHGGMFEPRTVKFLGEVGVTVVEAQERFRKNPQQVSLFGLIGAMKDPDVQRGMGFLMELSRSFGKMMAKHA